MNFFINSFNFFFIFQLREGHEFYKIETERAQTELVDGKPKISYSNLCERVNGLGNSLAQIKSEFSQLIQDKTVAI